MEPPGPVPPAIGQQDTPDRRILGPATNVKPTPTTLTATTSKPPEKKEFWCASCHRHRPIALLAAKRDKTRSYCRDCYEKRKEALRAIRTTD
jgi:hypothetical protein